MNLSSRFAAAGPPAQGLAARQDTGGVPDLASPVSVTEHQRLTAGTADLWRQLVHLCMETPT